jgi:hypothetical protein
MLEDYKWAGTDSGTIDPGVKPDAECSLANATRQCACEKDGDENAGRQVCGAALKWGKCECLGVATETPAYDARGPNVPDAYKDVTFDWVRTTYEHFPVGLYEGSFDSKYISPVSFPFGFVLYEPVSGDVRATFREKLGDNGEIFEIVDGKFQGMMMESFPFEADLSGEFNYATTIFTGALEHGYYDVGEERYAFQGVALAKYDLVNSSFVQGVWSVTEPEGSSLISSKTSPDAIDYSAFNFPTPLTVKPGDALPSYSDYSTGFKGGVGNWNALYVGYH